jgi:hypothetical protein
VPTVPIDYRATGIDVRADIVAAETRAWRSLAEPGTWWTGAERVAIAREVRAARRCAGCAERKAALSPAESVAHDTASDLRPAVVDAIHRVVTDPGRLSRRWVGEGIAAGVSDTHLVELVGVACTVLLVDGFARTLGADPPALPEPVAGEPSRIRPGEAVDEGYFVPTIPYAAGQRPPLSLYAPDAFVPNVGRGLSLVPDATRSAQDLMIAHYMPYERVATDYEPPGRPISRSQMELVAGRTSARNDCFY